MGGKWLYRTQQKQFIMAYFYDFIILIIQKKTPLLQYFPSTFQLNEKFGK